LAASTTTCARLHNPAKRFVVNGEGSITLAGYFDDYFKPGMSLAEAEPWVLTVLTYVTARSTKSGGAIQIVVIGKHSATTRWYAPHRQPFGWRS
jgi:20S proteasome alpha/beta subunit